MIFHKTPLDDINLVPRVTSNITSRNKIDCSSTFAPLSTLNLPLIASPMVDVVGPTSIPEITKYCFAFTHRFQTFDAQLRDVKSSAFPVRVGVSVGVNNYQAEVEYFGSIGITSFCIDTANGANTKVAKVVEFIKKNVNFPFIVAGNVSSAECFAALSYWGVNGVRVSIGSGAACKTRNETGIYRHPVNILKEISEFKRSQPSCKTYIIWDGGIKKPADLVKVLALGADFAMAGSIFAECSDSPARKYKGMALYRGSASRHVQGASSKYEEGFATELEITGTIQEKIEQYKNGLVSAMSYFNAATLEEFKSRFVNFNSIERNTALC